MPEFDLNLMRLLVALAQARHVTRAARLVGMSQSGFSTALSKARRQLGDELFVHTPEGMAPTARAQRIVEVARGVLETVRHGILEQPLFDPGQSSGEFRLVIQEVAEVEFLPQLLTRLQQANPDVSVSCADIEARDLQAALAAGEIDLALGYYPDLDVQTIARQRLYQHTYACIVRHGHPVLAGGLGVREYQSLGHVVVTTAAASLGILGRVLERLRIRRRVIVRTRHLLSLPALVAGTDLVATVPLALAARFARHEAIVVLPTPFQPPYMLAQQYWHRIFHRDPRILWLRRQVAALFNDHSDRWRKLETALYGTDARGRAVQP
ncbi:MAG: LysR family transcriptional regulator [Gammaproteobacteria bacterium]|nr:LysR family transcriptional regulator [Gammaproteobacteria bacterium]